MGPWLVALTALGVVAVLVEKYFSHVSQQPGVTKAVEQFLAPQAQRLVSIAPSWAMGRRVFLRGFSRETAFYRVRAENDDGSIHTYECAYDPREGANKSHGLKRYLDGAWIDA
jgi:hypothetical protein